jgi:D-glycero-alpha-D-manno-heptose-7-phosphate kinase
MIISKCPLRVSLVGGSTDLQSFIDKYGYGQVISFPISLYTYISLSKRYDKKYVVNYTKRENVVNPNKIKNDIARELIKYFDLPPLTMAFNADIPSTGSGLAASSSYMVAAVAAACQFKGLKWPQAKICKIAHEIELKFNPLTGYQDTYGCGLPSSKLMVFNGDVDVKFINLPKYKMYLYNTEVKRSSTNILKTINTKKSYPLLELVDKTYNSLNNPNKFFKLLNDSWNTKKKTSNDILNNEKLSLLDNMLDKDPVVKFHKLCGAGGGGYFLIVMDDVEKDIESSHVRGNRIKINIDNKGVTVWKI